MKKLTAFLLSFVMVFSLCISSSNVAFAAIPENNQQQIKKEGGTTTSTDGNVEISKTISPTDKENYFDITLKVTDKEIIKETTTDIVIVMDISETMNGDHDGKATGISRLEDAKAAANSFIYQYHTATNLSSERRLGLVTFNSDANIVFDLQPVNSTMPSQVNAITTPASDSWNRFTNIEGGLRLAEKMLDASDAAHKYIILLTDGFPTTYTQTEKSRSMIGYDTRNTVSGKFYDYVWKRPCLYGTDYSDTAAQKAQDAATRIKNKGANIVSIGIDISDKSQTIQNYLNLHQYYNGTTTPREYSTVERGVGTHPNNYVIGSATDSESYKNWLGTKIGGGPVITGGAFYTGDSREELNAAFTEILQTVQKTTSKALIEPQVASDPMGNHIDFITFYNKENQMIERGASLVGSSNEDAENTASYGSKINWDLAKSGYEKVVENGEVKFVYTLKYRVRLENELTDFVERQIYDTNGTTILKYKTTEGEKQLEFKKPQVEGYLGELNFTKTDTNGKALAGAQFTLTHNGSSCSVCAGDASISKQTATSNSNGKVSFERIPSGHEYTLQETTAPTGYQLSSKEYNVTVAYDKTYFEGKEVNASNPVTIKNEAIAPAEITLQGTKTMDGKEPKAGDFTFILKDLNGKELDSTTNKADGTFSFDKLTFDSVGTYFYEVVEQKGNDTGILYDTSVYHVTVEVTLDNPSNPTKYVAAYTIKNHGTGSVVNEITFANTTRESVSVQLLAEKTLEGRLLQDGEFSFVLTDKTDPVHPKEVETVKNDLQGLVTFSPLTFSAAGTYKYTIDEVGTTKTSTTDPYIEYDETVYDVVIEIAEPSKDNPNGPFVVESIKYYKDGLLYEGPASAATGAIAQFKNTSVDAGTADLTFYKVDEESKAISGMEFTLTHQNCADCNDTIAVQTAVSDANGKVSFKNIPSGHYYTLSETTGDPSSTEVTVGGVTYKRAADRHVSVIYKKVYVDGVEAKSDGNIKIVNVPKGEARVIFEAVKTMENADVTAYNNAFTFELHQVNSDGTKTLLHTEKNVNMAQDGKVVSGIVFDPIFYKATGQYKYTITEVRGEDTDVIYDRTVYYIVVDVTDQDNDGDLDATTTITTDGFGGSCQANKMKFVNRLRDSAVVSLEAKKVMSGTSELPETFTFYLKDKDGNILQEKTNGSNGKIAFDKIEYTNTGTYKYTIVERVDNEGHVVYDTEVCNVTVTVTAPEGEEKYVANVTYEKGGKSSNTFTNSYATTLTLEKVDESGKPMAGVEFTLKHNDDCCSKDIADIKSVSRGDGKIVFSAIPSGHTYVLKETKTPAGYVSAPDHLVKVVLGKASVYELGSSTALTNPHKITNYPEVEVSISGTKSLVGRDLQEGEFSFVLMDANGDVLKDKDGNEYRTTNKADGTFTFAPFTYTKDDEGKYSYWVAEEKGNKGGVTYDTTLYEVIVNVNVDSEHKVTAETEIIKTDGQKKNSESATGILFINYYVIDDEEVVTLSGNKELTGRDLKAEEFFFSIHAADENYNPIGEPIEIATNDAEGNFHFTDRTYTTVGIFRYVVRELNNNLGGVTYDTDKYYVTVCITDDGNGKLNHTKTITDANNAPAEIKYKNSYTVSGEAGFTLKGFKMLEGRALEEGEFTFELYAADENFEVTTAPIESVQNAADGNFTFSTITLDTTGTYYYVVKELNGQMAGIEYDDAVYKIVVDVVDNGIGGLDAILNINGVAAGVLEGMLGDIEFTNTYTPPTSITIPISVLKTVKNEGTATVGPEEFKFLLENQEDKTKLEAVSDKSGNAEFKLSYDYEDVGKTFTYKLSEADTNRANTVYSTAVYVITVTIGLDKETNKLTTVITQNGEEVDQAVGTFENICDEDIPSGPETGDMVNGNLWMAVNFVAVATIGVTGVVKRKKEKIKN